MTDTQENSRTKNTILNVFWLFINQFGSTVISIFSRRTFLKYLGVELLGVNSLFSDVLLLFSFADLGLGTAISFSLYKPIAEKNEKKIKSLLNFYKFIYYYIVVILIFISFVFLFFLSRIETDIPIRDLRIYYLFFQLNNIVGYLWAYRETYVIASQNIRVSSNITTIVTIIKNLCQIVVISTTKRFIFYLITDLVFVIINKIALNLYIAKKFPVTNGISGYDLDPESREEILSKSKSLIIHKIGNLGINQTDSLVASYTIGVKAWGVMSNYLLIKNAVVAVLSKLYTSLLPSFGNYTATNTDKKEQMNLFYLYDFINSWIYMFCFVAIACLSNPFISIIFGNYVTLNDELVFVFALAFLIDGLRNPISIIREATGTFENDKWYTIIAAFINLVSSIVLAKRVGLKGIYYGTILAMVILHIARSVNVFQNNFGERPYKYFFSLLISSIECCLCYFAAHFACNYVLYRNTVSIPVFCILMLIVIIVPNIVFLFLNLRNPFLAKMFDRIKGILRRS